MKQFIDDTFTITDSDNDRIHKTVFTELYNNYYNEKVESNTILKYIKNFLRYESKWRDKNGRQGSIIGIVLK